VRSADIENEDDYAVWRLLNITLPKRAKFDLWRSVECPTCRAAPGAKCVSLGGWPTHTLMSGECVHPARHIARKGWKWTREKVPVSLTAPAK
jgi:hypothetical protein